MDAGAWGIVAVLVIGTAVVAYGWWTDRAANRRRAEAMQRPPERPIPRFETDAPRPRYLSELEAAVRPATAPDCKLSAEARHQLTERLDGSPSFPAGWPARAFVTDPATGWCVLNQPLVLSCADPIATMREILPAIRRARQADRPLVLVAPDVAAEVLATLRANLVQGSFTALPILLADAGLLRSLSSLTGATPVAAEDLQAGYLPATHLGTCGVWVSDEDTSWVLAELDGLNPQ